MAHHPGWSRCADADSIVVWIRAGDLGPGREIVRRQPFRGHAAPVPIVRPALARVSCETIDQQMSRLAARSALRVSRAWPRLRRAWPRPPSLRRLAARSAALRDPLDRAAQLVGDNRASCWLWSVASASAGGGLDTSAALRRLRRRAARIPGGALRCLPEYGRLLAWQSLSKAIVALKATASASDAAWSALSVSVISAKLPQPDRLARYGSGRIQLIVSPPAAVSPNSGMHIRPTESLEFALPHHPGVTCRV